MRRLIAVFPILFESHDYEPGSELPTHNVRLVEEWIKNGSAVWNDIEEGKQEVKARCMTAPIGVSGAAYPSSGPEQDLVGKIPSWKIRGVQREPVKGRRKSSA